MSTLFALILATASGNLAVPAAQETERVVLEKDGGPDRGPDQPYSVREQGATDLEEFVGGKYIVVEGPVDVFVLAVIVALVVVLVLLL